MVDSNPDKNSDHDGGGRNSGTPEGVRNILDRISENPKEFRGAIPGFVDRLDDDNQTERLTAALALGAIAESEPTWVRPAIPGLLDLVEEPNSLCRRVGLHVLNQLNESPELADGLPTIATLLYDDETEIQELAADTLMAYNRPSEYERILDSLIRALDHENDLVRDRAETCICGVIEADFEVIEPYLDRLLTRIETDDNLGMLLIFVGRIIEKAVTRDTNREVLLDHLSTMLEHEKDVLRQHAKDGFRQLLSESPDAAESLHSTRPNLIPLLVREFTERASDDSNDNRRECIHALGHLGEETALPTLEGIAADEAVEDGIRDAAEIAAERIRADAAPSTHQREQSISGSSRDEEAADVPVEPLQDNRRTAEDINSRRPNDDEL